jgi:hypothetical protein
MLSGRIGSRAYRSRTAKQASSAAAPPNSCQVRAASQPWPGASMSVDQQQHRAGDHGAAEEIEA